jgi:hypothetical protein
MFSNTARAHWVVIYYDGCQGERQCTVVTATHGPLVGKRIIRGREPECREYYGPRSGHPASVTHCEAA